MNTPTNFHLRPATLADLPRLRALIPLSVRGLSQGFYSEQQIESGIRFVFGPDTQLIEDGTYFLVESQTILTACGGWSRRQTLYGGDQTKPTADLPIDPNLHPARIRAFFVHPDWARRGIGSLIMDACLNAARSAGFHHLELMATLPGEPLYQRYGFQADERVDAQLPDGTVLPMVRMSRPL